jgi:hypothetical protein
MSFDFPMSLRDWEIALSREVGKISLKDRCRGGALLSALPSLQGWELFKSIVRENWTAILSKPDEYPSVLALLYAGVAFFDYNDELNYWDAFSEAVADPDLKEKGRQGKWNEAYNQTCGVLGLEVGKGASNNAYVGTAVRHAGVPLAFWEDFMRVCTWALVTLMVPRFSGHQVM